MRTRSQIEAEVKQMARNQSGLRDVWQVSRKDMILLEVLLDIRDGLYEDQSTPTKRVGDAPDGSDGSQS